MLKTGYDMIVSQAEQDTEWDQFVQHAPGGHHVQTSRWAQVKSSLGWKVSRVIVSQDGQIVGGAQILTRLLPLTGSVSYIPKGPLCPPADHTTANMILQKTLQICQQHRSHLIVIQPPNNNCDQTRLLEELGFRESTLELTPSASIIIDLQQDPDQILHRMKHTTRARIRTCDNCGVQVREGSQADLDDFYTSYLVTAQRQGFIPYKRGYFDTLWQAFAPLGWVTVMIASYENKAVSGLLLIPFGDTVLAKMIGWTGEFCELYPNHGLFWFSIRWAVEHGYHYFDFEGFDPVQARELLAGRKPNMSKDNFKYGFGGQVVLFPPTYEYLPNKLIGWSYQQITHPRDGDTLFFHMVERFRKR